MTQEGQIITFYSYKGGTGRTMSIANTACLLARRLVNDATSANKMRVLAVDWDFEAPGLHRYFLPYFPANISQGFDQIPGCIDLLSEIWRRRKDFSKDSFRNRATAKSLLNAIDFNRYLIRTTIPGLAIIKSGRHDSGYAQLVNGFNWEDFFYVTEGFFPGFADFLREGFDYVLIDSRTGVTDTSGICTTLLPDKLVVPFTANVQSLSGVEEVVRRAVNYRKQSEDWRPLSVFPLPSRIDISRPALAEQWRNGMRNSDTAGDPFAAGVGAIGYQALFERLFAQLFGSESGKLGSYFDEVVLQHVPDYAYGEPIAVELEATDSRIFLRRSYEAFVDRLTELAGPWESLEEARKDRDLAALISEARQRVDKAKKSKDPKAAEDIIRLGFRIVEADASAANIEDMIGAVLSIAEFAIRANPSAVTLLAISALDRAARFAEDDWRIYSAALRQAGTLFDAAGIYEKAEQYRRQHLELLQRHLEADNPSAIDAMQELSLTLQARGNLQDAHNLQEARRLQEHVIEVKRRVLGDANPDTLASVNVLAAILQSLGDVDGARRLREQVDDISRRARGAGPTDGAEAMARSDLHTIRVFISSPGDVIPERERVSRVLNRLNIEFADSVRFEAVRWEDRVYAADRAFQAQMARPSETDLAVFIFWTRAGTPLPSEFARRPDGTSYISGTEFELEEALQTHKERGTPDILVYRKTAKMPFAAGSVEQHQGELQALEALWTRQFRSESGFKSAFSTFGSTDDFEELLEQHVRKWAETRIGPHTGITWPTAINGSPYRGLAPFYEEHARVFFGRRRQVEQIRERLIDLHARGCPFLLMLGASGSGKTSLLRAGLVPRLLAPGAVPEVDLWRRAVVFRPHELGPNVALGLARALLEHLPALAEGKAGSPEQLTRLLESNPEEAAVAVKAALALGYTRQRQGSDREPVLRLLLIVDQLEEMFTLPVAERDCLIRAIDALVRGNVVWVIAAMRSDAYGALLTVSWKTAGPVLLQLKDDGGQFDLQPPGPAEIREIIRGPARAAGIRFEQDATGEGVDDWLERDALEPGALPLLEFTLEQLYQRIAPNNRITITAYQEIGGVENAISHVAEQAYASVSARAQLTLPALLLSLVNHPDDGDDRMSLREADRASVTASPAQQELVDALVSRRLLILSAEAGPYGQHATLRAAHEALFLYWPRACNILADNRELFRELHRLEADSADWARRGRDDSYLMSGFRLSRAAKLRSEFAHFLAPEVREFIERSLFHTRRVRIGMAAVIALLVALTASLSGVYVLERNREAERQAQASLSLALDATNNLVELAPIASGSQAAEAAPLIARALAIARELVNRNPDNRQAQDYLSQLTQLCEAVKCVAP
jgi:cellulose biosynthesis protein BcsQ